MQKFLNCIALRDNDTQKLSELMKAEYDKKKEEQERDPSISAAEICPNI